jgi:type II secretory pathway component PulM
MTARHGLSTSRLVTGLKAIWQGLGRYTQLAVLSAAALLALTLLLNVLVLPPLALMHSAPQTQAKLDQQLIEMRQLQRQYLSGAPASNESPEDRVKRLVDIAKTTLGEPTTVGVLANGAVAIEANDLSGEAIAAWSHASRGLFQGDSLRVVLQRDVQAPRVTWRLRLDARLKDAGQQ